MMRRVGMGLLMMAGIASPARSETSAAQPSNASATATPAAFQEPAPTPKPPVLNWPDFLTIKGDLRYRFEVIEDDTKDSTRYRNRIRARLGAEAKANDKLKAGVALSTGQDDPVSGNQTIGEGFSKKEFKLDLAYLDYSIFGDVPNEAHLIAGKMKNPFITFPDDLCWDSDLTPEGIAAKGQITGDTVTLLANAGYMWVEERSSDTDAMLYAGQGAARFAFSPEVELTVGGSVYAYTALEGYDVIDWEDKDNSYGNSTVKGSPKDDDTFHKAYATEYTPVVGFAELDLWVCRLPLSFYSQVVANPDADDYDTGYMAGFGLGKAKNPKTYEVGYSYAYLEKDATLGMFTDSDRWGGGTDGEGHKFYAKYQIMKNLQAAVTYYLDDKKISGDGTGYDRVQIDFIGAF